MLQSIINQCVPALLTIIVGVLVKIINDVAVAVSIQATEQAKKKAIVLG